MRIPALGPRGEGWALAQLGLGVVIVLAGIAGWALFVAGVVGLGNSLTPFPKPSERSTLRVDGVYRLVRHPIYGGSMLVAIGWSLISSLLALLATAFLAALFELKARHEESMLVVRFPEYAAYRRRVRWRFVPGVH
ncbi:MAG: methyltransferase family protein [Actinomycetota bacterium]